MTSDAEAGSAQLAEELNDLIRAVLGHEASMASVDRGGRFAIRPGGDGVAPDQIPLRVRGQHLADLSVALFQDVDQSGRRLVTTRTEFKVYSTRDRTPLLRLDYRSDMTSDPVCHWQFHAERGAFTQLLSIAGAVRPRRVPSPHDLSMVHLPVGGERFRPCLEDVLEMLVRDCGVDAMAGWEAVLASGRERWRLRQLRSVVRDLQGEAAEVLAEEGWVTSPPGPPLESRAEAYRRW